MNEFIDMMITINYDFLIKPVEYLKFNFLFQTRKVAVNKINEFLPFQKRSMLICQSKNISNWKRLSNEKNLPHKYNVKYHCIYKQTLY